MTAYRMAGIFNFDIPSMHSKGKDDANRPHIDKDTLGLRVDRYRHSKKNSLRKNILGFGPFDHCLEGGKYSVQFEGIRNRNVGDLPIGNVDQSHWKGGSLFFRAHGETIFLFREEFFANLALFDLAAFSKLTWRSVVAGP
jgi:hypothetical protein